MSAWDAFASRHEPGSTAVLGGGVGGIELALAMAFRLQRDRRGALVTLVERERAVARELPKGARRRLERALAALGVTVRTGVEIATFDGEGLVTTSGERIAADFATAAVGAQAAPWLNASGLTLDPEGFVAVDAHLRSVNDPRLFAVGDIAHLTHAPRPKAGVFAVRQGPVLHGVLRATLAGETPPRYEPQADYLRLVSLGAKRALAVKHGVAVGGSNPLGAALWRLKDRIDQRFMAGLRSVG